MKKIDLVHTAIIVVALMFGYYTVIDLVGFLSYLVASFGENMPGGSIFRGVLYSLLSATVMAIGCVVLIRNGRSYAERILDDEHDTSEQMRGTFYIDLLKGLLGFVLIYSAPAFSDYLAKRMPPEAKEES